MAKFYTLGDRFITACDKFIICSPEAKTTLCCCESDNTVTEGDIPQQFKVEVPCCPLQVSLNGWEGLFDIDMSTSCESFSCPVLDGDYEVEKTNRCFWVSVFENLVSCQTTELLSLEIQVYLSCCFDEENDEAVIYLSVGYRLTNGNPALDDGNVFSIELARVPESSTECEFVDLFAGGPLGLVFSGNYPNCTLESESTPDEFWCKMPTSIVVSPIVC